mgnify:CR=1 FL=1
MNKTERIVADFKSSLVQFLDELIETFPSNQDFIMMRVLIKDQIPITVIMDSFVEDVDSLRRKVDTRDESFFTEYNPIFAKLGKEQTFQAAWSSIRHDKENTDVMWRWISKLVRLAENYKSCV